MVQAKPHRSLAAMYPEVARTWHPARNERWTPALIAAGSSVLVWWRCPAEHEWREAVETRTSLPRWKQGDRAACGICLELRVLLRCRCGEDARLEPIDDLSASYECSTCRRLRWNREQETERARQAARTNYQPDPDEAKLLLTPITPKSLPPVLAQEWRSRVLTRLLHAMVDERGYGTLGIPGAINARLARLRDDGDPLPTPAQLRRARRAGEPTQFMDRCFWTQGLLHILDLPSPRRVSAVQIHATVASLRKYLKGSINTAVAGRASGSAGTAATTAAITHLICTWGEHDPTGPWTAFPELVPPFIPSDGHMCGFIDLVLTRAGWPDLVIEIDSKNRPRSREKIQFASKAGAIAVWVRWNSGAVRSVPGVRIVDLVQQTRPPVRETRGGQQGAARNG